MQTFRGMAVKKVICRKSLEALDILNDHTHKDSMNFLFSLTLSAHQETHQGKIKRNIKKNTGLK